MDCERGLICGKDSCLRGSGFDSTDDCCRDPCDGGGRVVAGTILVKRARVTVIVTPTVRMV